MDEILGGSFLARIWRRRAERNRESDIVECAFRDREGDVSPLFRRWRSGAASLSPGHITFEPFMPLGLRMRRPWTEPIEIPVQTVSDTCRPTTGLEKWWVQGDVYELQTGSSTIEWVLPIGVDCDWATELVTAPSDPQQSEFGR